MSEIPTDAPTVDPEEVKQEANKLETLAHQLLCANPNDMDSSDFDQQLKNIGGKGKDFTHEVFQQATRDDTVRTHLDHKGGSDMIIFYADPPKSKQDGQLNRNRNYIAGGFSDQNEPYSLSTLLPGSQPRSICRDKIGQ